MSWDHRGGLYYARTKTLKGNIAVTTQSSRADALTTPLSYIQMGIPVFPLKGKIPLPGSKGSKDATLSQPKIEYWAATYPGCNWGAATGLELPTGGYLTVVDIDPDHGGLDSLELLRQEHGTPNTFSVRTGNNGYHLYLKTQTPQRNSASKIAPGIDVRGVGGYVVCAGSYHPETGAQYEVLSDTEIEANPRWESLIANSSSSSTSVTLEGDGDGVAGVAVEGQRNAYLASIAGSLRRKGLSSDTILVALVKANDEHCKPPLPQGEVELVAKSISRYAPEVSETPAGLAAVITTQDKVRSELETLEQKLVEDPGFVFQPHILEALSIAREEAGPTWARVRSILVAKKVHMRALTTAMDRAKAEAARVVVEPSTTFEDAPVQLDIPSEWRLRSTGVYKVVKDGEELILHSPLILSRRFKTVDEGDEQVELSWRKDGKWHTTICPRSMMSSSQAIVALADRGIPVTSNTSGDLIKYLSQLETSNLDKIPLEMSTPRTGWIGKGMFYPGHAPGVTFAPPGWAHTNTFEPVGTLAEWAEEIGPLRDKYPILRMLLATAACAPLLEPTHTRNFVLHVWGRSLGGKTAAMRAAASVWGSRSLVKSFNATELGMQNHAAIVCDLPVFLNERQSASGYKVDRIIYSLCEGVGKAQGARGGGNRFAPTWRCPIITNGEEPITRSAGMQGTRTRSIELECTPIKEEADAQKLYDISERLHGVAGVAVVEKIAAQAPGALLTMYEAMRDALREELKGWLGNHIDMLAVVTLGDYLLGRACFDAEPGGVESARFMVELAKEYVEDEASVDQADEAYGWITSVVRSNLHLRIATSEDGPVSGEYWGFTETGEAWILSDRFRQLCEDSDRSYRATLLQLSDKSAIRCEKNGKDRRFAVRRKNLRYVVISLGEDSIANQ